MEKLISGILFSYVSTIENVVCENCNIRKTTLHGREDGGGTGRRGGEQEINYRTHSLVRRIATPRER